MAQLRPSLVVFSTAGVFDVLPPSARLVLGQYAEDGWNHGKRVYKRLAVGMQKFHPEVVIFFWDEREGGDLSGWWIASQVAGGEVWSRNPSVDPMPPKQGWHCPADGPMMEYLKVVQPNLPHRFQVKEEPRVKQESEEERKPRCKRELEEGMERPRPTKTPRETRESRPAKQTLTLVTRLSRAEAPRSLRPLLGDYVHQGFRRGRMTFCKSPDPHSQGQAVWLYWTDGEWLLADGMDGRHIYGVAQETHILPPRVGWQVPPYAVPSDDLCLILKPGGQEEEKNSATASMLVPPRSQFFSLLRGGESSKKRPAGAARAEERRPRLPEVLTMGNRLSVAWEIVARAESDAEQALERSRAVLDSIEECTLEALRPVTELMQRRVGEIEEGVKSLACRPVVKLERSSGDGEELELLAERLRITLVGLQEELSRAEQQKEWLEWQVIKELEEEAESDGEDVAEDPATLAAEPEAASSDGARQQVLAEREQGLRHWVEAVNSLAGGDSEQLARCRELLRARILRGHAEGNLADIDWYVEPLPELY